MDGKGSWEASSPADETKTPVTAAAAESSDAASIIALG